MRDGWLTIHVSPLRGLGHNSGVFVSPGSRRGLIGGAAEPLGGTEINGGQSLFFTQGRSRRPNGCRHRGVAGAGKGDRGGTGGFGREGGMRRADLGEIDGERERDHGGWRSGGSVSVRREGE